MTIENDFVVRSRADNIRAQLARLREQVELQAQAVPPFSEWLRAKVGYWVLCRRSPRSERKYGSETTFLSEKQYRAHEARYEALTGLPAHGSIDITVPVRPKGGAA